MADHQYHCHGHLLPPVMHTLVLVLTFVLKIHHFYWRYLITIVYVPIHFSSKSFHNFLGYKLTNTHLLIYSQFTSQMRQLAQGLQNRLGRSGSDPTKIRAN